MMKFIKDKNNRIYLKGLGYRYLLNKYFLFRFAYNNFLFFYFNVIISKLSIKHNISKLKYYCVLTARSSSVFKFFKLSRIKVKSLASFGEIVGLRKSS